MAGRDTRSGVAEGGRAIEGACPLSSLSTFAPAEKQVHDYRQQGEYPQNKDDHYGDEGCDGYGGGAWLERPHHLTPLLARRLD